MAGGQVRITVSVSGGFDDAFDDLGGDDYELRVRHEAGACAPCVANNDPHNVPFWGCNGNIDRIDPDDGKGNLCRCSVEYVKKR